MIRLGRRFDHPEDVLKENKSGPTSMFFIHLFFSFIDDWMLDNLILRV